MAKTVTKPKTKPAFKTRPASADVPGLGTHPATPFLGFELTDVASGATGVCNTVVLQSNGNVMVGIQPKGDGKERPKSFIFDVAGVDIVGEGISARTPAPEASPFAIGDEVKHIVSPFRGTVMNLTWFGNGCCAVTVVADALNEEGLPVHTLVHSNELRKYGVKEAVVATPPVRTGGPSIEAGRPGY